MAERIIIWASRVHSRISAVGDVQVWMEDILKSVLKRGIKMRVKFPFSGFSHLSGIYQVLISIFNPCFRLKMPDTDL